VDLCLCQRRLPGADAHYLENTVEWFYFAVGLEVIFKEWTVLAESLVTARPHALAYHEVLFVRSQVLVDLPGSHLPDFSN